MTQNLGRGVWGVLVFALIGCGGSIDLHKGDGGAGGGGSDAGGTNDPGGAPRGGSNIYPGGFATGGTANLAGAGNTSGAGNSAGAPGAGQPPVAPEGVLAFDDDGSGLGRTIGLRTFIDNCVQTLTDPTVQAKQPAFSKDGAQLAYAAQDSGVYQLYVRTLASGDTEEITTLPGGATSPAFSPDGSKLAFVTGDPETFVNRMGDAGTIMLVDLKTKQTTEVLAPQGTTQYNSPVFHGAGEIIAGSTVSLIGVDLKTKKVRDIVPITGRIPNPQDPSLAPDGLRYVYSDFCGGSGLNLYIARIDGSTGDTCASAIPLPGANMEHLVSADWGQNGFIAAEIKDPGHGIVMLTDPTVQRPFPGYSVYQVPGRNPAWAPKDAPPMLTCDAPAQ